MNEFQAQGRALRAPAHPLVKLIDMETTPELQKQIDELRVLWAKTAPKAQWRTPVIGHGFPPSEAPTAPPVQDKNPCIEIPMPPTTEFFITIHRGGGGGGPKCECGKDKHGFAFHMRFCPKWEPIC